jgi:uncharacterized protein with GYD domain
MSTYLLFGNYTQDSIKKISARRTAGAAALLKKFGGELITGYALLGDVDVVLVVALPDNEKAVQASIAMTKQFGISFRTLPAVSIDRFDKLVG